MSRLGIKDIADKAGVSFSTVSMALRGHPAVKAETRERIRKLAEGLGYVPNAAASSLSGRRTNFIGVAVHPAVSLVSMENLSACSVELFRRGLNSRVVVADLAAPEGQNSMLAAFSGAVDGIISYCPPDYAGGPAWWRDRLAGCGGIKVVFDRQTTDAVDFVSTDYIQGGAQAARWLLEQGCRRPAYAGSKFNCGFLPDRLEGFIAELAKHGIEPVVIELKPHEVESIPEAGFVLGQRLRAHEAAPDGVFVQSDYMGLGILKALQGTGIPVIGFDALDMSRFCVPSLPSIGCDRTEKYRLLLDMLTARIDGDDSPPKQVFVPTELITGKILHGDLTEIY